MPKTPFRGPTKMKPTKLDFEAHAHSKGARTVKAEGRKNAAKSPAVKSVKSTAHKSTHRAETTGSRTSARIKKNQGLESKENSAWFLSQGK